MSEVIKGDNRTITEKVLLDEKLTEAEIARLKEGLSQQRVLREQRSHEPHTSCSIGIDG